MYVCNTLNLHVVHAIHPSIKHIHTYIYTRIQITRSFQVVVRNGTTMFIPMPPNVPPFPPGFPGMGFPPPGTPSTLSSSPPPGPGFNGGPMQGQGGVPTIPVEAMRRVSTQAYYTFFIMYTHNIPSIKKHAFVCVIVITVIMHLFSSSYIFSLCPSLPPSLLSPLP